MNKHALATLAAALAALLLAAAPARPDADHGSGDFGRWTADPDGLPAYDYTMRSSDPRAQWDPKLSPKNSLHWHQLGNSRFNANAYNLGFVKLLYGEAGLWWLNDYDPPRGEHAGGFGWLIDGATALVDRDDLVPPRAGWERRFGVGYYLKRLTLPDLVFERRLVAPRGDSPVLVSVVTITNKSDRPRPLTLIEYWDVNPRIIPGLQVTAKAQARMRDQRFRLGRFKNGIVAIPAAAPAPGGRRPRAVSPRLPDVFLGSDWPVEAWITDPRELFDGASVRLDAARLRSAGVADLPAGRRSPKNLCLASRVSFTLAPGASRSFTFFYGYAPKDALPAAIIDSLKNETGGDFARGRWSDGMPALDLPSAPWLGRELKWDYYYFLSAGLYDQFYQRHHIPQGGNYLYFTGMNGATRDYAAFVQTLSFYDPAMARETLEFMMRAQEPNGRFFYDLEGVGRRYTIPYRPGDLDIWFLGALADYVLLTRDFGFLDREVQFYPPGRGGESGTVWEHARRSFNHLLGDVGLGAHRHPRLMLSDWNDEMTFLTAGPRLADVIATIRKGESVMNSALALAFLPRFSDLAQARGDVLLTTEVEQYLGVLQASMRDAWVGDHFLRSYDGRGRPFGADRVFLEPQAFALLAAPLYGDTPPFLAPDRRDTLLRILRDRLSAPSQLGMLIGNDSADTLTTRKGEQEEGGIWLAINTPAAVAIARFDRARGWDEVLRNTLARHAEVYPHLWYGIWSGPDAWNAPTSDRPGETWYMKTPVANTGPQGYPIQNSHSHCQTMWAVARLAGVTPDAAGWIIDPRVPDAAYGFSCALYSLRVAPDRISGAVRLPTTTALRLLVRVPPALDPETMVVTVDGRELLEMELAGEFITVPVEARAGKPVEWSVEPAEFIPN